MKLIIFDCDGTLVDSQHAIVVAMDAAFASEGLAAPMRAEVVGVVGLSLATAVARLLPKDADGGLVMRLAEAYKLAFADLRARPGHDEPMYLGVREAIEMLVERDGVSLGIATGKSRRGVAAVLERERLTHAFLAIETADTHPSKPHPSMILAAMEQVGARPADTLMIGDTTFDMDMAAAAGVGALGVGWGYHPAAALSAAGAQTVLEDGMQLAPTLACWLSDLESVA